MQYKVESPIMKRMSEIFDAGATAMGDVVANIARVATGLLSILFTVWKHMLPAVLRADGNHNDT